MPPFAAPLVTSDLVGDANVARHADQGQAGARPACSVTDPRALNSCTLARRGPLVLAFFTESAGRCVDALDALQRVAVRHPDVGFAAVAIRGDRADLRGVVAQHGWRFPVAQDRDGAVANLYGVAICPTVVLARRGGVVMRTALGSQETTPSLRSSAPCVGWRLRRPAPRRGATRDERPARAHARSARAARRLDRGGAARRAARPRRRLARAAGAGRAAQPEGRARAPRRAVDALSRRRRARAAPAAGAARLPRRVPPRRARPRHDAHAGRGGRDRAARAGRLRLARAARRRAHDRARGDGRAAVGARRRCGRRATLGLRLARDGEQLGGDPDEPPLPAGQIVVAGARVPLAPLFGEPVASRLPGRRTRRLLCTRCASTASHSCTSRRRCGSARTRSARADPRSRQSARMRCDRGRLA